MRSPCSSSEIVEEQADVVQRVRALLMTRHLHLVPGGQVGKDLPHQLFASGFQFGDLRVDVNASRHRHPLARRDSVANRLSSAIRSSSSAIGFSKSSGLLRT